MFRLKTIALAISIAFYTQSFAQEKIASKPPVIVKIGHVSPLSGPQSESGLDSLNGAKMAIEDANKMGLLVNGSPIEFELVGEDDKADRDQAVVVANGLVKMGVFAVVGHLSSSTSVAALPIYASNKIIQISPSATAPVFTEQALPTVFRAITNDAQQGRAIGEYVARNLGGKKIALITENIAYAQGVSRQIESTIGELGGSISLKLNTDGKEMQVLHHLAEIKKIKPDVIVFSGLDTASSPYAVAIRRTGLDTPIVMTDGSCNEEFLAAILDDENLHCSRNGRAIEEMALWPDFAERYRQAYGMAAKTFAAHSYDAVKAIVLGIKETSSVSTDVVASQMHQATVFGIAGHFAFDKKGDINKGPVSFYVARSGGWFFDTSLALSNPDGKIITAKEDAVAKPVLVAAKSSSVSEPAAPKVTTVPAQTPVVLKMDESFDSYTGFIQFAGGATKLGPRGRNEVKEVAALAKTAQAVHLRGRVGRLTLDETDRKMAVGRSVAIKTALVKEGVEDEKIVILHPLNNNLANPNRRSAANRGVDIKLIGDGVSGEK